MKTVYIVPKARNLATGETVTHMELSGRRFASHERALCQELANVLAKKYSQRTLDTWQGYVETVNVGHKA